MVKSQNSGGWSKFNGRWPGFQLVAFLTNTSRESRGTRLLAIPYFLHAPDYSSKTTYQSFLDRLRPNGIFLSFAQNQFSFIITINLLLEYPNAHRPSHWLAVVFMLTSCPASPRCRGRVFLTVGRGEKVRQIAVRFSEQMVGFGDPREVILLTLPALPQARRWADQRNWIYDFVNDLPAGVACSFSVRRDWHRSRQCDQAASYSFKHRRPGRDAKRTVFERYSTIDETRYSCSVGCTATADSIQKNVHCEADGISEQIPVKLIIGKLRNSILDWREAFLTRYYQVTFKRGNNEDTASSRH